LSRTAWDAARAEDAAVIAPAPPVSSLGLHHFHAPREHDPLFVRRMIIPILLTLGLLLCGAGTYLCVAGADDALSDLLPPWAPMAFIALGAMSLALGILNMLWVRQALTRPRPR
jgi:hypothetical protein